MKGAGSLDQRVQVVTVTRTPDGYGGQRVDERVLATVRVHVAPVRGHEQVVAGRKADRQRYRLTARNQGAWQAVNTDTWLLWEQVRLQVVSAPLTGRALYRTIEAETEVT